MIVGVFIYYKQGAGGKDVVAIRYWNGFSGPDGRTMLKLVKRFNEENPGVRVTMQRMKWGTYYNKLFVASIGGRASDVFVIHMSSLERFAGSDFLRTIDNMIEGPDGIDVSDFSSKILSAVSRDMLVKLEKSEMPGDVVYAKL